MNSPHATRVAILGGGLSGLYAAHLLTRQGVTDYVVLEARDALGGRIASVDAAGQPARAATAGPGSIDRFDVGPTWFWPDFQRELDQLVRSLDLPRFEQFETGDMVVERSPQDAAVRMRGYASAPASVRLVGGMSALVEALQRPLDPTRIRTGHTVRRLRRQAQQVEIETEDATGHVVVWQVEQVLLALPPRLAVDRIAFEPALPASLARQWQQTPTWMAPHAKYVAIYDTPFWRAQGLSGEGRSARGPMGEIHDASMPGGSAALFGFLGVPAQVRSTVSDEVLRQHCRAQLARMFDPQAATPSADFIKDWAQDPLTATSADMDAATQHAVPPPSSASSGPWQDRLTGIGSEWSAQYPGYLAGAIEAARLGVDALQASSASLAATGA